MQRTSGPNSLKKPPASAHLVSADSRPQSQGVLYLIGSLFPCHGWVPLGATSSCLTSLFPPCPPDHLEGGRAWCQVVRECPAGPWRPRFASPLCHCHPLPPWAGLFPSLALVCPVQREGIALAAVLKCSLSALKILWPSALDLSIPELFPRGQASLCPSFLPTSCCCTPACPQCLLLFSLSLFEGRVSKALWRVAKKEAQGSRGKLPLFYGTELPSLQRQTLAVTWPISCRKFLMFFPYDWPRTVTLPKGTDDWPEEQLSSSLPGTSP